MKLKISDNSFFKIFKDFEFKKNLLWIIWLEQISGYWALIWCVNKYQMMFGTKFSENRLRPLNFREIWISFYKKIFRYNHELDLFNSPRIHKASSVRKLTSSNIHEKKRCETDVETIWPIWESKFTLFLKNLLWNQHQFIYCKYIKILNIFS